MTRDTQAIDALIEAVRGGDISTSLIGDAMDTMWQSFQVLAAFDGDVGAAIYLQDVLLHGRPLPGSADQGGHPMICDTYPDTEYARALLLATLKAWKETKK